MSAFQSKIMEEMRSPLRAERIETLQVNLGRYCNQSCRHCHVEAGPGRRKEMMSRETLDRVLEILRENAIGRVDLTGGAPELHPDIAYLLESLASLGKSVLFRSNLTALDERDDLIGLLRKNRVEVVASLPCYLEENVDAQRGRGAYRTAIGALKKLNAQGFGREGSGLLLTLVYNPQGAALPPSQEALEADYKKELLSRHGIVFNNLIAITNMPLGRFKEFLSEKETLGAYADLLRKNFNNKTLPRLMCRRMVNIGWEGGIFDCDFNQMLNIAVNHGAPRTVRDFDLGRLQTREIVVGDHCFGCTAGRGSSCGGELKNGI